MLSIVLSRRNFREYDQMIALYTKEQGKVVALARGVKKITSKNSAHLEPFSFVHATIERGKEIDHLTKVQPVEYFSSIRYDYAKSLAAGFAVSVTDMLVHEGERDARVFELLGGWLRYIKDIKDIANSPMGLLRLTDGFIVSLFHCLGFTPILDRCVVCGKTYHQMVAYSLTTNSATAKTGPRPRGGELRTPNHGFYFSGGGIVCASCRTGKEAIGEEIFDCGLKEVSDMQVLLKGDWRLIAKFQLSDEEQKKLHRLVYEYALYHSERRIADWGRLFT